MISQDQMMAVLIEACPTFEPRWIQLLQEWGHEPEGPPLYVTLADYVRHLTDKLQQEEVATIPIAFDAIEKLHAQGDAGVQEAATIGILEPLQTSEQASRFETFLGPVSGLWCTKLNRFWDGDANALRE